MAARYGDGRGHARTRERALERVRIGSHRAQFYVRRMVRSRTEHSTVSDSVRAFLKEIRIEHTFFALPFAYVGAVMGARGVPSWWAIFWITVAVLGARTAAMAANRYFDK